MSLQEFPDARVNVPLHEIVVRAEHMDRAWPEGLAGDVFEFVDRMLWDGRYPRSAIPRDAVLAASVYYFITTFDGDGLHVFLESTGWDEVLNRDIRQGLQRLGFDELDAIFADLEDWITRTDPERFEETGWWKDPVLQALDARFPTAQLDNAFCDPLADWIRGWPFLRTVPGAQYQAALQAFSERNRSSPV